MRRRFFISAAPAIVAVGSLMSISSKALTGTGPWVFDDPVMYMNIGSRRLYYCDILKQWRDANPEIAKHWSEIAVNADTLRGYSPDVFATELERKVVRVREADYAYERRMLAKLQNS